MVEWHDAICRYGWEFVASKYRAYGNISSRRIAFNVFLDQVENIYIQQFPRQIVHKLIATLDFERAIFIYKNLTLTLTTQEYWLKYCALEFENGNQFMYDLPRELLCVDFSLSLNCA